MTIRMTIISSNKSRKFRCPPDSYRHKKSYEGNRTLGSQQIKLNNLSKMEYILIKLLNLDCGQFKIKSEPKLCRDQECSNNHMILQRHFVASESEKLLKMQTQYHQTQLPIPDCKRNIKKSLYEIS